MENRWSISSAKILAVVLGLIVKSRSLLVDIFAMPSVRGIQLRLC